MIRRFFNAASAISLGAATLLLMLYLWGAARPTAFIWSAGGRRWSVIIDSRFLDVIQVSAAAAEPFRRVPADNVTIYLDSYPREWPFWAGSVQVGKAAMIVSPDPIGVVSQYAMGPQVPYRALYLSPPRSLALAGALPIAWAFGRLLRRCRARDGLCPVCQYDLRASTGRCPECGSPIPIRRARHAACPDDP